MAVQQNSLKYFGGQQSGGESSARQVVIERANMTAAFTEDEYQKCLSAISLGYAVAVEWTSGSSKMQAQLSIKMADGSLHFSITLVDLEMIYIVDGSSPHSITAHANSLNCDQFVLVRADMSTQFSNTEYQDCVDAVTAEKAVCVQFEHNSRTFQAQLTQVVDGTGVLVFEIDIANIHITYEVDGTNNSHTITEIDYQSGVPIFDSLQTAIAFNTVLHPGDIFETNGFHSSGDGGAARYKVSSTGTANGKNCIQLSAGKNAFLQYGEWVCPEELGYNHSDDVVPYITFIISTLNVQHIKLKASGTYHWKSKLTVSMINGFEIVGEGDWGYPRKFTYINVDPTTDIGCMMELAGRSITLKNLDIEVTGSQMLNINGITSESYSDGAEFYFNFDNIRMNSFKECWKLSGGIKWHIIFNECQPANCKIGVHFIESSSMLINMKEVYFNHCAEVGLWFEGNVFTAKMDSCNFGSMDVGVKCTVNDSQYLYQNLQFNCCNFEDDNVNTGNRDAVFFDCYDASHLDIRQNITISNSNFTLAKSTAPVQDTTNRYFRLGKKTNLLFINNQILGMNEPLHPEWVVYPKLFWNTSVLPTQGSVVEVGNNLFFDYPNEFLPYVVRNGQSLGVNCYNAKDPTETAWDDCDTFLPRYSGEMRIARVSAFENTANMPTTGIFGYLMSFGVIESPNPRVLQVLFASNNNIYTRVIRDTGGGWTVLAWKTITAS